MNLIQLAWLSYKNHVHSIGIGSYATRVVVQSIFQIVLLTLIFSVGRSESFDFREFSFNYPYFIALFALGAAIAPWETELFNNIGEHVRLDGALMAFTKSIIILVESAVPIALFSGLIIYYDLGLAHFLTMLLIAFSFSVLGIGISLRFGFGSEKSLNNFSNALAWILGFGPGPFFGVSIVYVWQTPFPGSQALAGLMYAEWVKLLIYAGIGTCLIFAAQRPASVRVFQR